MPFEIRDFWNVLLDEYSEYPTFNDLKSKNVFIDTDCVEQIEKILNEKHICLLQGAEGRGKTVVSKIIGYKAKSKKKYDVWLINVPDVTDDRYSSVCNTIASIGNHKTLFIFENAHVAFDDFVPRLIKEFINSESKFLFVSRSLSMGQNELLQTNPFDDLKINDYVMTLLPDLEYGITIINQFISSNDLNYTLTDLDRKWIKSELGEKTINLRRLSYYLETWLKGDGALYEISKFEVYKNTLKKYMGSLDPDHQRMILNISAVFQYDVPFHGYNYDLNVINKLCEKKIICFLEGYYYRFQHSSDASFIIEAEANIRAKKSKRELSFNYLKEYYKKTPENIHKLLKAIFSKRDYSMVKKLYNDKEIYDILFEDIKNNDNRTVFISFLNYFTTACGSKIGEEIWKQIRKYLGADNLTLEKNLIEIFSDSPLFVITYFLKQLLLLDEQDYHRLLKILTDSKIPIRDKLENASFRGIENFLNVTTQENAEFFISCLDPQSFAEKAIVINLQSIFWFQKKCIGNTSTKKVAKSFVEHLYTSGNLIKKIRSSGLSTVLGFLNSLKKIDSNLHENIMSRIVPYWKTIYENTNLTKLSRQLYRYLDSYGDRKIFAKSVIESIASKDLQEKVEKIFTLHNAKPIKSIGKLIYSINRIYHNDDSDIPQIFADSIAQNIDFSDPSNYTIEELCKLLINIRRVNIESFNTICKKIISDINIQKYASEPIEKDITSLLRLIWLYDNELGKKYAEKIFEIDFIQIIKEFNGTELGKFLYNLYNISYSKIADWINIYDIKQLKEKLVFFTIAESVHILWTLFLVNKDFLQGELEYVFRTTIEKNNKINADYLSLLGLFSYIYNRYVPKTDPFDGYEIAEKLVKDFTFTKLSFVTYFMKGYKYKRLVNFLLYFTKEMYIINPYFSIENCLKDIHSDREKLILEKIFAKIQLPKEPENTFDQLVSAFKKNMGKTGKGYIAFGSFLNFLLRDQNEDAYFKNKDTAIKWIKKAVDYGLFNDIETTNLKYPNKNITLLRLSDDILCDKSTFEFRV